MYRPVRDCADGECYFVTEGGWLPLCRVTFRNQNLNKVCSGSNPSPAAARLLILMTGLFGIGQVEGTVALSGKLGPVFAFRTTFRKLEQTVYGFFTQEPVGDRSKSPN